MKFQFSEKKVKLPEKVHAYAEKKVMKLARYFDEDAEALIVFSVEKNRNKAELTVHGAGTWFRASESTSDMFASIDACVASSCSVSIASCSSSSSSVPQPFTKNTIVNININTLFFILVSFSYCILSGSIVS